MNATELSWPPGVFGLLLGAICFFIGLCTLVMPVVVVLIHGVLTRMEKQLKAANAQLERLNYQHDKLVQMWTQQKG